MSRFQWLVLIAYPLAVGAGQILFKLAATRMRPNETFLTQATDPVLLAALGFYGALSVVWLFIVKEMPLTSAYPFVALSFVFTPLLAWLLLGETINPAYLIGIALICAGVFMTQRAIYVV